MHGDSAQQRPVCGACAARVELGGGGGGAPGREPGFPCVPLVLLCQALVMLGVMPFLGMVGALLAKGTEMANSSSAKAYAEVG